MKTNNMDYSNCSTCSFYPRPMFLQVLTVVCLAVVVKVVFAHDKDRIPIKIVEELSNIDIVPRIERVSLEFDHSNKGKPFLSPVDFTGPDHLKKLIGSCYEYSNERYKFNFCPFQNVTQESIHYLREPFQEVLGVWGEWIIEDNEFNILNFIEGNKCGERLRRSIKIKLECGITNRLLPIEEPSKCSYIGTFKSPLFCGVNALTVYPRLPTDLQHEWDTIESERHFNILTDKGYKQSLNNIFVKAGFILLDKQKHELNKSFEEKEKSCEQLKEALELKVKELSEQLELHKRKWRNSTKTEGNEIQKGDKT